MSFDLENYFRDCSELIDKSLNNYLPSKTVYPSKIHEAMRYSMLAGGKRIRPILCMAASEACGGSRREVMAVACALEMIHTFSLIHDDLPAMDDDDLRRGQPTNHKVYGEAIAVLAGDGLLAHAFYTLTKMKDVYSKFPRLIEVMQDVALATGSTGMVGGQAVDMEMQGQKADLDQLKKLHRLKTGRLITVSVTSGAKIATQDEEKITSLESYGEAIGLAFQIADDVLDIEGGHELGKDIGSDLANGKLTYPSVMGLDKAKDEAKKLIEYALGSLKNFGEEANALRAIASYIIERKK